MTTLARSSWLRRPFHLLAVVALTGSVPAVVGAQPDMRTLEAKVVRVTVGRSAASGFLWGRRNQVVTSLHTFLQGAGATPTIRVTCFGGGVQQIAAATVTRVYAAADLVLLTTERELTGCAAFVPADAYVAKPAFDATLYTWGFHAGATGGTSRKMTKAAANPEVLNSILHEPVKTEMRSFNIPDVTLPIYYVQGGLLPGYSGAPVVDGSNRLVGIVDGGLDNGASDYNWVIPVENVGRLMASQEGLPRKSLPNNLLYSSGLVEAAGSTIPRFGTAGQEYQFVKTKTRSLGQLASTSSTPFLTQFLNWGTTRGVSRTISENTLFDLYEDPRRNLIIAIPSGQPFRAEPPLNPGAGTALRTAAADRRNGDLMFQEFPTRFLLGREVLQVQEIQSTAFANAVFARELANCNSPARFPWPHTCELIERRTDPFPGGALLRVGVLARAQRPQQDVYAYKNFAVDFRRTFYTSVEMGILYNNALTPQQFANLAAVHITTFGARPAPAGATSPSNSRPAAPAPASLPSNGRPAAPAPVPSNRRSGRLAEGASVRIPLTLRPGRSYEISGECDLDCEDLDIAVRQNGRVLESDEEDDAFPIVSVSAASPGVYELEVTMRWCVADACEFNITFKEE